MSDHEQDDLAEDASLSHEDIHASSDHNPVTGNNCPRLPTPDQKGISQALFKVPEGFQALLKHITRELLNAKPKDPYLYIADYLRHKLNDKRRGLLEQEYFHDDSLNIDIKPPMHYLQQTSLANVTCPSTSAFDALANDAATTLQASYRGMQGRGEVQEIKRDGERPPQPMIPQVTDQPRALGSRQSYPNTSTSSNITRPRDICAKITPAVIEGCGYGQKSSQQQRINPGGGGQRLPSKQWTENSEANRHR